MPTMAYSTTRKHRIGVMTRSLELDRMETGSRPCSMSRQPLFRAWLDSSSVVKYKTSIGSVLDTFLIIVRFSFFELLRKPYLTRTALVTSNVDITFQPQRFNGSLLKENIYRQDASPEVDAAWEALGANCKTDHPEINKLLTMSR
jgi:hypothetical protein